MTSRLPGRLPLQSRWERFALGVRGAPDPNDTTHEEPPHGKEEEQEL
jgi:hypothetical protein